MEMTKLLCQEVTYLILGTSSISCFVLHVKLEILFLSNFVLHGQLLWYRFQQFFGDHSLVIFVCIGIIVRNTLVVYDREQTKIGFWKTNCAELWERLQTSIAPPPLPPNSGVRNSSEALEPSVAPSVSQHNASPGIMSCQSSNVFNTETSCVNMWVISEVIYFTTYFIILFRVVIHI